MTSEFAIRISSYFRGTIAAVGGWFGTVYADRRLPPVSRRLPDAADQPSESARGEAERIVPGRSNRSRFNEEV